MSVWINGNAVDPAICTSVTVPPLLFGDAGLETCRVHEGRVMSAALHADRLTRTLQSLHLANASIRSRIDATFSAVAACGQSGCLRVLAGDFGEADSDETDDTLDVIGLLSAWTEPSQQAYERGVVLVPSTIPHPGLITPGKTCSYAWSRAALREVRELGGDEALLLRDGAVVEASTATIIWSEGGQWWQPPPAGRIESTTLIELEARGYEVQVGECDTGRLVAADEVLLLSSLRLVRGVARLGERLWDNPDRSAYSMRAALLSPL